MSTIKERICGAVDLMNDKEAEKLWMFIQRHYAIRERTWSDVEEVEPDEVDLIMLREAPENPDCQLFVSSDGAMKKLVL